MIGTFDESGYEWNPFLCGPSSQKNYGEDESPSQPMPGGGHEYDDLINMNVFYVIFGVSYTIVSLTIAAPKFVMLYLVFFCVSLLLLRYGK
ncbi:hypothetical protein Peur_033066 [Populus x canadensis]